MLIVLRLFMPWLSEMYLQDHYKKGLLVNFKKTKKKENNNNSSNIYFHWLYIKRNKTKNNLNLSLKGEDSGLRMQSIGGSFRT